MLLEGVIKKIGKGRYLAFIDFRPVFDTTLGKTKILEEISRNNKKHIEATNVLVFVQIMREIGGQEKLEIHLEKMSKVEKTSHLKFAM